MDSTQSGPRGFLIPDQDGYIVPEGHISFFSTPVMEAYFKKVGFSRVVPFEPEAYLKQSRLFQKLAQLHLADPAQDPCRAHLWNASPTWVDEKL